jgi:pyrimidine deaminase RibD-like protein
MATTEENISAKKPARVILGIEDCKRLKARAMGMKRAALNIQLNAKTLAEEADALINLFDALETELSVP